MRIDDVLNGTGLYGGAIQTCDDWQAGVNVVYPAIADGTPITDSNDDGIPDGWPGMPSGAIHSDVAPNGYTYLENYLNELAGDTVAGAADTTRPAPPTNVYVR